MAQIVGVPAGLIMRLVEDDIEVLVSSRTENNPYKPGEKEHFWDSGLYCETVVQSDRHLIVPDAISDPAWANNPDVKLNMISYLGFPIHRPNGDPFGTICVLDHKPNAYSENYVGLVEQFPDLIESHLRLVAANQELMEKSAIIVDKDDQLQELRQIIPICSYCKDIRDDDGFWQAVESYISELTETDLSHGICPSCLKTHFPEFAKERLSPTVDTKN
ncbi:MAG: GAF domain-containing protein [Rhodospirillales bacterium]|nr:GAF domain-containing protein [Rhodospirillales bacterium]